MTTLLQQYTNYCDLEIGGTNFGEEIQPAYLKRFGISKHSSASAIYSIVGNNVWSEYFTFAFVRNPYLRCLSTFNFLRKWDGFNIKFSEKMKNFKNFEEYVLSDIWSESNGPDEIFRPQKYWLVSNATNEIMMDYIGRVELIDEHATFVIESIGNLKGNGGVNLNIPKLNVSANFSLSEFKNDSVVEKIAKKYKKDFELFGYSFDPGLINIQKFK